MHGGPLRLIVLGYFGVNNVKWVQRLALTATESGAHIQASGYRFRDIGQGGGSQYPSMWRMPVKSWLNGAGADGAPVGQGVVTLHGVAFSGERGIERVEVSGDNGQTWQPAELVGPDLGPDAWRSFVYAVELPAGDYRFVSRATDKAGDTQPRDAVPNERGYGHNGWRDAALSVAVVEEWPDVEAAAPAPTAAESTAVASAEVPAKTLSPLAQQGRSVFLEKAQPACGVCHQLGDAGTLGAVGPNLDTLQPGLEQVQVAVARGVGAMPAFGAQLSDTEIKALATYVAEATAP